MLRGCPRSLLKVERQKKKTMLIELNTPHPKNEVRWWLHHGSICRMLFFFYRNREAVKYGAKYWGELEEYLLEPGPIQNLRKT